MTLTLTPQELRDLLNGRAVALVADPDPLRDPTLKPPPWEPGTTTPSPAPSPSTPIWPAMVRHDPPVDMTPHATCAPRGED